MLTHFVSVAKDTAT